jgi:hypothetical protein
MQREARAVGFYGIRTNAGGRRDGRAAGCLQSDEAAAEGHEAAAGKGGVVRQRDLPICDGGGPDASIRRR